MSSSRCHCSSSAILTPPTGGDGGGRVARATTLAMATGKQKGHKKLQKPKVRPPSLYFALCTVDPLCLVRPRPTLPVWHPPALHAPAAAPQDPLQQRQKFWPMLISLGATGATTGPFLDGIHSRVGLIVYDKMPITLGQLHTSLWMPPLLMAFYVVLGSMFCFLDYRMAMMGDTATREALQHSSLTQLALSFGWAAPLCCISAVHLQPLVTSLGSAFCSEALPVAPASAPCRYRNRWQCAPPCMQRPGRWAGREQPAVRAAHLCGRDVDHPDGHLGSQFLGGLCGWVWVGVWGVAWVGVGGWEAGVAVILLCQTEG